jgi:PAS domain S-box-containing protein
MSQYTGAILGPENRLETSMTELSFRKLLLRFAAWPVLCCCAFLVVIGLEIRSIAQYRLVGAQATSILLQSNLIQKSLMDEETGLRGYLASQDTLLLQPYLDGMSRQDSELSALKDLAASDDSLSNQIVYITDSVRSFNAINKQLLDSHLIGQDRAQLLQRQKAAMDNLRQEFSRLNASQLAIREQTRASLTMMLKRLPIIIIGSAVVLGILVIWYGTRLYREITAAFQRQLADAETQRDSLRTTLVSIGDGVIVCEPDGSIRMLNPAGEALTGWTQKEAIETPFPEVFKIVHEETRVTVESPVEKVLRTRAVVALANHTSLIRKDGTEIPIDDSGAPILDAKGELSGVVLVFRSVLERRRAMRILRESRERLNSIYNTSLEYIGILNPEGTLLDCNRASLTFAGNSRDEVLGQPFWGGPWFRYTPGMAEQIRAIIEHAAAGHTTRTELSLMQPSGNVIIFDFSLTPVFDPDGAVLYMVPEARDISDLKRAQAALIQSEKLAAAGRLAASIAHEINNPLEAVTNLLYLARHGDCAESVQSFVEAAEQELRRVAIITNQTLRFHKQSTNPERVHPAELIETVLSVHDRRLKSGNIAAELRHDPSEPIVCFAGDVRQVLNNLISNSIEAMNGLGGRLLVRTHVSRNWETQQPGFVFTVADTGSGIPADKIRHIFDPFFTTKGSNGNGLGLWISREIASRQHGSLRVRSSTRKDASGTVFRFFLPAEPLDGLR